MACRKKSGFNDLIEIAATLPWWMGVALAGAAYLLLHPMATRELATAANIE